ncbi:MAG: WecB/TagA/CpsF family glycosyltransferase [Bacteroidales bacterium]
MIRGENSINVLNCPCTVADKDSYQNIIWELLNNKENLITIAINARKIVLYNKNPDFRRVFEENNILPVPDGIGATVPMRIFNKKKTKKIDFPGFILDFCNINRIACYFLGTTEIRNKKAVEEIRKTYPGIKITGRHSGFNINEDELVNKLLNCKTKVLFVAMGSPLQELFCSKLAKRCKGILFVGVGGRFDILAKEVKRAPKLLIILGLEWTYRFFSEPRRIKQQRKDMLMYLSLFFRRLIF